tara:strand:+ start:196 stop:411 length:216 start_codon:yes stop_codon:yes gene_type:complete
MRGFGPKSLGLRRFYMKPLVGLGTVVSLGTVVRIDSNGVTVDNQGVKEVFSFREFEDRFFEELNNELHSSK